MPDADPIVVLPGNGLARAAVKRGLTPHRHRCMPPRLRATMISSMISISKIRSLTVALGCALVGLLALSASGCGGARGAASVEYSVSAQRNYEKGMDALQAEDWLAAAKYFAFIKSRFPYSKFAVLSELRIADAEAALVDKTKAAARATDDYVNDNPWQAVGIAAGIGFLLGVIIGRR